MVDWNFAEVHLDNHIIIFYNFDNKGLYEQSVEVVVFSRIHVIKKEDEFTIYLERPDGDWTVEYTVKQINYIFEPIWYKLLEK